MDFLEFLIKIEMFFKRKLEIVVMMNLIRGKNTFWKNIINLMELTSGIKFCG